MAGPALLVRYVRTQTLARALAGGVAAMAIAEYFWWKGVLPLAGAAYVGASIVFGIVNLTPYLLDRAVARRVRGFAATLTLPLAMIALEALAERLSPIGTWGSFAYTQAANLPLIQLVSLTGLPGITFLVLWTAAFVNWIWEGKAERRGVVAYAAVLAAVFAFGGVRLLRAPDGAGLRVAAITPAIPTYTVRGDDTNSAIYETLRAVRARRVPNAAQQASFRARAAAIQNELLAASEREARGGAKLIVWSEGAGIVDARDEPALVARASAIAQRTGAFLALAFLTVDGHSLANKTVLVDPGARTLWTYHKAHPVPGMEDQLRPGAARLPVAETPIGRLSTAICFDADFPRLVRQAGRAGADLLILPADDWQTIAPLHANMAKFRAIEQGLTVVRSTSSGLSVAFDRYGRRLGAADYFEGARVMRADVPSR